MKPLREVFKTSFTRETIDGEYGYEPFIKSMGYPILWSHETGDYQGQWLFLLENGSQVGILIFSYGSCSGCDALQACDTFEEAEGLRETLASSIRWGSAVDTLKWLVSREWDLDHTYYLDNATEALAELGTFLINWIFPHGD